MISRTLKAAELENFEVYKFVKVAGNYRFTTIHVSHDEIVEKSELPQVEAAGMFIVEGDEIAKASDYSMSLKKNSKAEHFAEIATILGKAYKNKESGL